MRQKFLKCEGLAVLLLALKMELWGHEQSPLGAEKDPQPAASKEMGTSVAQPHGI